MPIELQQQALKQFHINHLVIEKKNSCKRIGVPGQNE